MVYLFSYQNQPTGSPSEQQFIQKSTVQDSKPLSRSAEKKRSQTEWKDFKDLNINLRELEFSKPLELAKGKDNQLTVSMEGISYTATVESVNKIIKSPRERGQSPVVKGQRSPRNQLAKTSPQYISISPTKTHMKNIFQDISSDINDPADDPIDNDLANLAAQIPSTTLSTYKLTDRSGLKTV